MFCFVNVTQIGSRCYNGGAQTASKIAETRSPSSATPQYAV
jgi:hypothetical protein